MVYELPCSHFRSQLYDKFYLKMLRLFVDIVVKEFANIFFLWSWESLQIAGLKKKKR